MKLANLYKLLPYLVIIFSVVWVFRKFFFQQLLPIPSDILVGAYYPWLENKWGYVVGVPVKNPMPSDVISMLYPWRILGISYLKQGILPLWDPTILLGTPLLANFQSAILNPVNFLYWIFDVHITWSIQVVLQPILIASATYLFLKNLRLKSYVSVLGGISFAFCGFAIVWMEYNTINYTLIYIPLIFLLIDKLISRQKVIYSFLIALVLTMQIVSGYPQISIYTLGFSFLYFMYRLYHSPTNFVIKSGIFVVGIISGILISMVQLIPSFELTALSIRQFDTVAADSKIQFLPWGHFLTLLIPDFFGNPGSGNYWSIGSFDNFAFSIPVVFFFFFILSVTSEDVLKKEYLIFLVLAILSLILATNNPISSLISNSPIMGLKSTVAARILIFFTFFSIVIACIEMNKMGEIQKHSLFKLLLPAALVLGIIAGLAINYFYSTNLYNHTQSYQALEVINIYISHLMIALRNSILPSLIIFTLTFTLLLKKYLGRFIFVIIFILLIFDITRSANKYLSFNPKSMLYPKMQVFSELKEEVGYHRFDREKAEFIPSNTWIPYGLKAVSGQNALYPSSISRYLSAVNGNSNSLSSRFVDITGIKSPLFNTLDIEYYLALNRDVNKSTPSPDGKPSYIFNESNLTYYKHLGTVSILRNNNNLGLAWFPQITFCNRNTDKVFQFISKPEYNPSQVAYINCPNNSSYSGLGTIGVVKDFPLETLFSASLTQSQYLIISKTYYPGWKVYIDGKLGSLTQGNSALMAAFIPSGNHQVKLKYDPLSFKIGFYITALTLSGWVLFFTSRLFNNKK